MQTVGLKYLKLKCVISASTNVIANVFKQLSKTLPFSHWTAKQITPPQTQTIGCAPVPLCLHLDESTYGWFNYSCPCILCYLRRQYFIINILTHFNFKENKNNRTNKCLRCFKIALLSVKFILFHILNIRTCKSRCNASYVFTWEHKWYT